MCRGVYVFVAKFNLKKMNERRMGFLAAVFWMALSTEMTHGEIRVQFGDEESLLREGEMQYEVIKTNSRLPEYGACWLRALEDLHRGCESLTDEVQSRLALKFANCFLEKAGLNPYPCEEEVPIRDCLRNVDHNAFTAYSNFFMHARSMCFFVSSQLWHRETRDRVRNLAEASDKAHSKMKEFRKTLEEAQESNLEFQKQMLENGTFLSRAIEVSKSSVRDMLEEFRSSTDEQRSMIFEIFDRVSKLQNLVLSEVSWIYSVVFYGASLLAVYIVTSTKRTSEARFWLLVVLSVNFAIERAVTSSSLPAEGDFASQMRDDISSTLYDRVWNVRKCGSFVCILILTYFAIRYKDYNKINNVLLEDIRRQNLELKQMMQSSKLSISASFDATNSSILPFNQSYPKLTEEDDEDSSVCSFDTMETDRTFNASIINNSYSSFDDNESDTDLELDDGEISVNENFNYYITANNSPVANISSNSIQEVSTPKRRGRSMTPVAVPRHEYNLRSRRLNSYNIKKHRDWDNPILDSESPNAFAKLINKVAQIHKSESDCLKQKLQNQHGKDKFSSDDE